LCNFVAGGTPIQTTDTEPEERPTIVGLSYNHPLHQVGNSSETRQNSSFYQFSPGRHNFAAAGNLDVSELQGGGVGMGVTVTMSHACLVIDELAARAQCLVQICDIWMIFSVNQYMVAILLT
jgi:hypothetical protein